MLDIIEIADEADMIVNGYAFTRCDEGFIKDNYKAMYMKWSEYSRNGYYEGNK